jgi:hypothetical protein
MGDRRRHCRNDAEPRSGRLSRRSRQPACAVHLGSSAAKALENAVAVECIAQMALLSLQLAPNLEPIEEELLDKHFRRKHGAGDAMRSTADVAQRSKPAQCSKGARDVARRSIVVRQAHR